jgi:protein SCO1
MQSKSKLGNLKSVGSFGRNIAQLILFVIAAAVISPAQGLGRDTAAGGGIPANKMSPQLQDVGIDQKLDSQVPLDLTFRDETGQNVALKSYFGKRPVILSLVYFNCPMLCPEVVAGMTRTLNLVKLDLGKDYDVLTISFDPKDTPLLAAEKKRAWLQGLTKPGAQSSWHFLTGDQDAITTLTGAVGFRYRWDSDSQQFAHATAIMVLTPEGKTSKYFYGADYSPTDLRLGLIQASHNKIGSPVDQILLFCCKYNAVTGKYDLIVSRVLSLSGLVTILVLGSFLFVMFRLGPKRTTKESKAAGAKRQTAA